MTRKASTESKTSSPSGRARVKLAGGALFVAAVGAGCPPPAIAGGPCIPNDLPACNVDGSVLVCRDGKWEKDGLCNCTPLGMVCAVPGFVGVDRAGIRRRRARRVRPTAPRRVPRR